MDETFEPEYLICKHCQGSGMEVPFCGECDGFGWVEDPEDGGTMSCPECGGEPCSDCDGTGELTPTPDEEA